MKKLIPSLGLIAITLSLATGSVRAADAKSYQVTGPVLEVTSTTITVMNKDNQKWQIASDASTTGTVKVGDKVTIKYQMVAKSIEVKTDKAQ